MTAKDCGGNSTSRWADKKHTVHGQALEGDGEMQAILRSLVICRNQQEAYSGFSGFQFRQSFAQVGRVIQQFEYCMICSWEAAESTQAAV